MKYDFHTWRKVKIWKKDCFLIEADSQDEAIKKAKELFNNDELFDFDNEDYEWLDTEWGDDDYPVDYWDEGKPTFEMYHDYDLIIDNTPAEILRDNLITDLLGGDN